MKSLRTAQSILLVLLAAACGDTVELGGPPDGGEAGSRSTSSTTGSGSTTTGSTSVGAGGSDTTSAGSGTTGVGGNPGTTTVGAGGSGGGFTVGAGGSGGGFTVGTGGSGGTSSTGAGGAGGGTVCGGFGGAKCPAGSYCDYDPSAMCGAADQTGICRSVPAGGACLADCPGVCGCDGKFYCNACNAHMSGTDDSTDRSCIPTTTDGGGGKICGGLRGAVCDQTSYCDFPPTALCGAADATGTCQPRPQVCPADCTGVCGCDGKFYCNACLAQSAGFDVSPSASCQRDR